MDKKIIYLTGFMGSGKSTIGPIVANVIGCEFHDLDSLIKKKSGMEIREIFDTRGEEYFRNLERETLLEISKKDKMVISLGGGTITNQQNLETLKKTGIIFYLKLSPAAAYNRLKYKKDRPVLLSGLKEDYKKEDLMKNINDLYDKRKSFYEQSDFIINTDNVPIGRTVDMIVKIINREWNIK
jgi:shikimate kinase